jgi:hypothetical protein
MSAPAPASWRCGSAGPAPPRHMGRSTPPAGPGPEGQDQIFDDAHLLAKHLAGPRSSSRPTCMPWNTFGGIGTASAALPWLRSSRCALNSRSLIRSTGTGDYHRHGRTTWTYLGSELLQGVFRRPIRDLLTGLSESAVVPPGLPALEWCLRSALHREQPGGRMFKTSRSPVELQGHGRGTLAGHPHGQTPPGTRFHRLGLHHRNPVEDHQGQRNAERSGRHGREDIGEERLVRPESRVISPPAQAEQRHANHPQRRTRHSTARRLFSDPPAPAPPLPERLDHQLPDAAPPNSASSQWCQTKPPPKPPHSA